MADTPPLRQQAVKLRRRLRRIGGDWTHIDVFWRPHGPGGLAPGFYLRGAPPPYCDSEMPELHLGTTYFDALKDVHRIRQTELGPERRERGRAVLGVVLRIGSAVLSVIGLARGKGR
jgi:hypothetical protein